MKAEIISIGTELLSGQCLDTNSQWLSTRLAESGIPVHFHTTVGDDLQEQVAAFLVAVRRADLVLITGGLGPTQDDLTREALAELAGVDLEFHAPSLEHIERLFARRGRAMPETNRKQAYRPAGSDLLENPVGTAPGIWMELSPEVQPSPGPCILVAMPGVPSEMKRMFQHEVVPRLQSRFGIAGSVIVHRRIHCFGLGESAVEQMLGDLTRRGREPLVGITVHEATITLRITAQGPSAEACRQLIEPTVREIYQRLGSHVFGEEDEHLQDAVGRLLKEKGLSVATAELGTGGLVANWLSGVTELEGLYRGGLVAAGDTALKELLNVSPEVLAMAGPFSRETAGAMALGCRMRFGADLALAVAAPLDAASADSESPPQLYVALATPSGFHVEQEPLAGDPGIMKSRSAKTALNFLRLYLLGNTGSHPDGGHGSGTSR